MNSDKEKMRVTKVSHQMKQNNNGNKMNSNDDIIQMIRK